LASRRGRSTARFRRDLDLLYQRGCRPITVSQLVDADVDVPSGMSAVVVTFDDASPGQFRFAEKDGRTEVDPESAVGIWLAFNRAHPDSKNRATFCLIPAGREGHAFFGDKGIEGRKTAWRFEKLQFLVREGFELCARTLWHADLSKADDHAVQEQIARSVLAIDSAVPGYRSESGHGIARSPRPAPGANRAAAARPGIRSMRCSMWAVRPFPARARLRSTRWR